MPTTPVGPSQGFSRLNPDRRDPSYLVLAPLVASLAARVDERLAGRSGLRVIDVGCGNKPYESILAPYAGSYRGVEPEPSPYVDDLGTLEELPYEDASVDVVLCTQVLEHVQDPRRAVREIHRVLAPGGTVFASTHGVFVYHPDPPTSDQDYWRWTEAGLRKLFNDEAEWARMAVDRQGEVLAALAFVGCQYVDAALGRTPLRRMSPRVVSGVNAVTERLDRKFPPRARDGAAGSMSANFLLVAEKP